MNLFFYPYKVQLCKGVCEAVPQRPRRKRDKKKSVEIHLHVMEKFIALIARELAKLVNQRQLYARNLIRCHA